MNVRVVRADERVPGDPTPGMAREEAFAVPGLWAGLVRAEPGTTSEWHHHGDHDTAVYVLSGSVRVEEGPGGRDMVEARTGDFMLIPKGTVHRESNPSDEEGIAVVVRAGTGQVVVNVDGPEPDG